MKYSSHMAGHFIDSLSQHHHPNRNTHESTGRHRHKHKRKLKHHGPTRVLVHMAMFPLTLLKQRG
jgi:hypothetical protein